jgi:hypothetical protein
MTCAITIQSVSATGSGNGSVLQVTVIASECKLVEVSATCAGGTYSQFFPTNGQQNQTVLATIDLPCPCQANVSITAQCVDDNTHLPIPGCTAGSWQGPIPCADPCCVPPHITFVVGSLCDANNHRTVTFTTVFTVPAGTPSACFPLIGQLAFPGNTYGPLHVMSAAGTYTFTDTASFDASVATTYPVSFVYANPTTCPPTVVNVSVDSCTPADCCPVVSKVQITVGDCQPDCRRQVTISTSFDAPAPGCLAEAFQWHFTDSSGAAITNVSSNAFLTTGASPNVQSFVFDPAASPITATLGGLQYPNCPTVVRTIDLTACNEPPACPTINAFSANVLGCENVGGQCLHRVEFTLDAQIYAGCGANAGTTIEIDFGDGDQTQLQFTASGHETVTVSHHYVGGTYQASLNITNPACIGQAITVQAPPCDPADCNIPSPCPPMPKPPWWCLCTSCYVYSQKPAKGWCKALLTLVGIYVSLVVVSVFMGWISLGTSNSIWQNLGAGIVLIGTLPVVLWYSKACSDCCAACALMLAMVLAIICVIILAIYDVPLFWWNGLLALFGVFLTWLLFNNGCKQYAEQNLTQDTWCK